MATYPIIKQYVKRYDNLIKFLIGGVIIVLLQVSLLYVFSHFLHWWYLLAAQLSFTIAFFVSFFLYRDWVFPGGVKASHHQFILYAILTVINFFMNGLAMFLFVDGLGIWYIYSQVIVKILISIVNYFLYNVYIFNK